MQGSKKPVDGRIDPPIAGEIVHEQSGARRVLSFDHRHKGKVSALWPQCGNMLFDLVTGYGASDARPWRLTLETARRLTGNPEHEFKLPTRTRTGKPAVYGVSKETRQESLFAAGGEVRPEVAALSVPPAPFAPATGRVIRPPTPRRRSPTSSEAR